MDTRTRHVHSFMSCIHVMCMCACVSFTFFSRISLCQTLFPFLIVHMGYDVWMRPLGPVAAEGAAWVHFHSVAEALRYLHSEAGGSLRHLKHTQVARAAKNDGTRDSYSFTFKEPASMVVTRPARPQPATTPTVASFGLTVVRCACCGANICCVRHSCTRCNATVDEACMARVGTEVHCFACTCRACRRALTAHLVQCRKCNFRAQMVFVPFVVPHALPVGVLQCGSCANSIKSSSCQGLGFDTTRFVS